MNDDFFCETAGATRAETSSSGGGKRPVRGVPEGDALSVDLTRRVSKRDLVRLISRMAHAQDASGLRPAFSFEERRLYSPCVMLGLLAFAFAVGKYHSEEIATLAREEPELRPFCQEQFPDAGVVKCFRERNRLAIQDFLARVIQTVWEEIGEDHGAGQVGSLDGNVAAAGITRKLWISYEAAERLRRADCEDRRPLHQQGFQ